jgi:hypothetical protein
MQGIKIKIFYFSELLLPVLYTSCLFGILHEFIDILNLQVWVLWFLLHLATLSIFIIYQNQTWFDLDEGSKKHLLYISIITVLWYFQKVYAILYYPTGNFVSTCNRELLILHFSLALTLVVVALGVAIVGCFRF